MKTRNITLCIAAVIIVVPGCTTKVAKQDGHPNDLKTKWILVIGDGSSRVEVNKSAFMNALQNANWSKDVKYKGTPGGGDEDHDIVDNNPILSKRQYSLNIPGTPNGINVTQRIGFNKNNEEALKDLLKQLKD